MKMYGPKNKITLILCLLNCITETIQVTQGRMLVSLAVCGRYYSSRKLLHLCLTDTDFNLTTPQELLLLNSGCVYFLWQLPSI